MLLINTEQLIEEEIDYATFQTKSLDQIKKLSNHILPKQWQSFCLHLNHAHQLENAEKFMLLQLAWKCIKNDIEAGELAQLIVVSNHLKMTFGTRLFHTLFSAEVLTTDRQIKHYVKAVHLLVELQEDRGLHKLIKSTLPKLSVLVEELQTRYTKHLIKKFPERNIDEICKQFIERSNTVEFLLAKEEVLDFFNKHYGAIKEKSMAVQQYSVEELKDHALLCAKNYRETKDLSAKYELIAIIMETIRRHYKIMPYDTQLTAFWALIHKSEKLKGRIAQIKTGEGKSTIIAMLAAFNACQGDFVDVITSSANLAERDCKKYSLFFNTLGLSASHITDKNPKAEHFHGQVLYGTNTDFEFAFLRDGLNHKKLRYSNRLGKFEPRTYDVVIVDEADNLFLNQARHSAIIAIPGKEDFSWIYEPILNFTKKLTKKISISIEMIAWLRSFLLTQVADTYHTQIKTLSDDRLLTWLESAETALFDKQVDIDYQVGTKKGKNTNDLDDMNDTNDIVIVDYVNTGRLNKGSHWQNGLHQFLQVKHDLKVSPESLTVASASHPTYFNMYQHIIGVTGTLGETCERDEIQKIYNVESFDVPPRFPCLRVRLPDYFARSDEQHSAQILKNILEMREQDRPVLVLFKTIKESNIFSHFLQDKNIHHQLINETQAEDEEYLVARAGEKGMITIATNTAGRGTDIILSPECKEKGLHVIFAFYPNDLRVEGQGFGRASRQGQPGSCCMILNLNDKDIQTLMKSYLIKSYTYNVNYEEEFARFNNMKVDELLVLVLERIAYEKFKSDLIYVQLNEIEIIPTLNYLRTQQITEESAMRYHCAQREALYFEKMQFYFKKLEEFHHFFEEYRKNPTEIKSTEILDIQKEIELEQWQPIGKLLKDLLNKVKDGIEVDWSSFYDQFKEAYLKDAKFQWASFYNEIHHIKGSDDINILKAKIEDIYLKTSSTINIYLSPQKYLHAFMQTLLALEHRPSFSEGIRNVGIYKEKTTNDNQTSNSESLQHTFNSIYLN